MFGSLWGNRFEIYERKEKKYSQEEQDRIFTMHKLIMEKHYKKKSNLIIDPYRS